jgi:hypothetical protein
MTEDQWIACQKVDDCLWFLGHGRKVAKSPRGRRKLRLFACACCRQVWDLIQDEDARRLVELAEGWADGTLDQGELDRTRGAAEAAYQRASLASRGCGSMELPRRLAAALQAVLNIVKPECRESARVGSGLARCAVGGMSGNPVWDAHEAAQLAVLRDIFGNPFRPVVADPSWLTSTVVSLAEGIYADRAFDRLPILADALQDAGCDGAEVLDHCRGLGPHVRGCWVIDLLLGKS